MRYERRSTYFGQIRHDGAQFGRDACLVARQWGRLAWYVGLCIVLTARLVLRIVLRMLRVLMPIPGRVGRESQYAKRATGLNVAAFDVMAITFGAAVVIGHLW
jgi:hypothetical protein